MGTDSTTDYMPAAHYDRVHDAWRLIMGQEFHFGYFDTPNTPLERATAALTQFMVQRARIEPGNRILDVGCGTGRQACDLAADHLASVLGITTSAIGVKAATSLASRRHVDARFEQRDGTDNGLQGESFDVAWVLESSHLMRDRDALLRECVRVLAPGGRLAMCDVIRKRDIAFREVLAHREEFATLRAAFGDAHMQTLESHSAVLTSLGMDVIDCSDISDPTFPTFAKWRANVEANMENLNELLGAEGVHEFVESTHILESFWQDGTLGYGILAAVKPH
jgi:27-O-demethylrifamycin SV methyltransferase